MPGAGAEGLGQGSGKPDRSQYQESGSLSLKPLAKGLLAIFSCVICREESEVMGQPRTGERLWGPRLTHPYLPGPPQSGGPGAGNHRGCEGRGMAGQMLTESRGRREGLGPVCMGRLRLEPQSPSL